ncbi:DUF1128 domain-containing protein [Evansella cellulosilytica]|uniref:UPF0435 protein Bcell_2532 n=1 Tax=Evansella cellulosilytica (strain ATCC 21833 / DSM 2522 / FERM P-1141 / JCM 9156 / N-4) TaxID=649639 RepID=E6TSZ7_EVAC2|nr:DUF1128 domain-containing protein [Evansella cellulosilytica]ADU30789.1 protein of unknown function DUF1128 [Evansella cellulosilytica DSM 2522]
MNTKEHTRENLSAMIEEIKKKLQIVNAGAMKAEHYSLDRFSDVEELYEMVMKKSNFSVSEMDAIVTELGNLRDK